MRLQLKNTIKNTIKEPRHIHHSKWLKKYEKTYFLKKWEKPFFFII
ncbi:MAG: hypothetical protein L6420_01130 [Elusimicrobia bacterium]|nr:hypothetical protein [Elusimicrobiota bacterium]